MGVKVAKFGGTSLAGVEPIRRAVAIIGADAERRYVVASAPGKRDSADEKITDLLYRLYDLRGGDYAGTLGVIRSRFAEIADGLGVEVDLGAEFAAIEGGLVGGEGAAFFASRGEYLNSLIISRLLGWPFVDAADVVRFSETGEFLADATDEALSRVLAGLDHAVVPGFYGATPSGRVVTFSRGGSDVTGALVARAVGAAVYENWTDVSGILAADPRIVTDPRSIGRISYANLRALAYLGASVLHEDAVNPVRDKGIPINIRNSARPEDEGTWITDGPDDWDKSDAAVCPTTVRGVGQTAASDGGSHPPIIGIAGKTGFTALTIAKAQLSGSTGTAALLAPFDEAGIPVELAVSGVDAWVVVVRTPPSGLDYLVDRIRETIKPDSLSELHPLALVGVVESTAASRASIAGAIAAALADAGIHADLLTAGVGGVHIAAVPEGAYRPAVAAIYDALG